jgi:signal transduction histidine kinase/CheY-like chemotaxis protein
VEDWARWLGRAVEHVDRYVPPHLAHDSVAWLRARLLLLYTGVIVAICPLFVGLSLADNRPDMAATTGAAMLVGALSGTILRRTGSVVPAGLFAVTTYGITHATLFRQSGFFDLSSLYWFMSTPMFATFLGGARWGAVGMVVVSVVVVPLTHGTPPRGHYPDAYNPTGDVIGAWVFGVILVLFGVLYESIRARSTKTLQSALQAADAARTQAEESGQARSRLVASISHELRTPLGGVVGLVHLLEKTPLTSEQRELTNLIGESADAVVSLLNDLLEFARLDVGTVRIDRLPLDVRRVVRGVVGLFAGRAADVVIAIDVAADCPDHVVGDARRLRQVLWNLIGNAVKFAPLGSGRVDVQVSVDASSTGEVRLRFAVSDTGPGISDDTRQRLFQPFVQGEGDLHRRLGGTGLGLAISRNLVVALGGTGIDLQTRVGSGSTFAFVLPFARVGADVSAAVGATGGATRTSGRVLIVEDDPVSALVASRLVESTGLACDVVGDGNAAVASARAVRYDLILMDGNLPGRDGYDTARAIRAAEEAGAGPRVPIVALTATSTPDERQRALAAGMDDHVHKPLDPARLDALLATHLRGRTNDVRDVATGP